MFTRHRASRLRRLLALVCVLAAGFACADARAAVVVAAAKGESVAIYSSAGGHQTHSLASPNGYGVARVFLVTARRGGWLRLCCPCDRTARAAGSGRAASAF